MLVKDQTYSLFVISNILLKKKKRKIEMDRRKGKRRDEEREGERRIQTERKKGRKKENKLIFREFYINQWASLVAE